MTDDIVLVETRDHIRLITLNRPAARNALDHALRRAVADHLRKAEDDDDVAVIVLTGADPAFCAGLDVKEIAAGGHLRAASDNPWHEPILAVKAVTKPIIAAINGSCATGGLELVLGCDFLIASERALFADTHARVGLLSGGGLAYLLPRFVGLPRARELSLTGRWIDAHEALAYGLVNRVVPHEELVTEALNVAMLITRSDSAILRRIRALYQEQLGKEWGEALAHERQACDEWRTTRIEQTALASNVESLIGHPADAVSE